MPHISIIVPVYNVEKYVSKCIRSILNQSYKDFELLLIDDGSTDSSGKICDNYSNWDRRCTVYHKKNYGVSSARNLGLQKAKGEWIVFIDSDDFIGEQYIEGLLCGLLDDTVDFVHGGFIKCTETGELLDNGQHYDAQRGSNKMYLLNTVRGLPFSKLFKSDIIRKYNLSFNEKIRLGEDMIFTIEYISHINNYAFVEENNYFYTQRNNSLMHTCNQHFDEAFYIYCKRKECIDNYYKYNNMAIVSNYRESQLAAFLITAISLLYGTRLKRRDRIDKIKEIIHTRDYQILKHFKGNFYKSILSRLLLMHKISLFDFLVQLLYSTKRLVIGKLL